MLEGGAVSPVAEVAMAVVCNVAAQLALKSGANVQIDRWQTWASPAVLLGVVLYAASFALTLRIYAQFPLSLISPLMAGAIFVLVSAASVVLFSEPITPHKVAGMVLIVGGIVLLSRSA